MGEKAKIREVGNAVQKAPQQIQWANIISPVSMVRGSSIADAGRALGGRLISASAKYDAAEKKAAAESAEAAESANLLSSFSKILVNTDSAIASGENPQAVQNAAYTSIGQLVSGSKHLSPSDQLDLVKAGHSMVADAINMKMKVDKGVLTIADGYGNVKTIFDQATKNLDITNDIIKSVMDEKAHLGIRMQELNLQLRNERDPEKRQELSNEMQEVVNLAKMEIGMDHELATMKLKRELSKEDSSKVTAQKKIDYVKLQNVISDEYLNYSGEAFMNFVNKNRGKNPELVKAKFNQWIKESLSTKAVRETLTDVDKSTDDLMSDLSSTIKIGEDLIVSLSDKSATDFEIDMMTSNAKLKTLGLIGEDGLVKIAAVRELGPIMNINYVMARQLGPTFNETQFASSIIGSLVGGKEARKVLESSGTIPKEHADAILTSMKGYYSDGVNSIQGMDLYNTMAFASVMEESIMTGDYSEEIKNNFLTLKQKLMSNLPKDARSDFDNYVNTLKSFIREKE